MEEWREGGEGEKGGRLCDAEWEARGGGSEGEWRESARESVREWSVALLSPTLPGPFTTADGDDSKDDENGEATAAPVVVVDLPSDRRSADRVKCHSEAEASASGTETGKERRMNGARCTE